MAPGQRSSLGQAQELIMYENIECEQSLYIFSKSNIFRQW